jgi:hypothetical protein
MGAGLVGVPTGLVGACVVEGVIGAVGTRVDDGAGAVVAQSPHSPY